MAYGSILDRLASGAMSVQENYGINVEDVVVSEAVRAVIEDSGIPLGAIIESVDTDTQAGILEAYEVFELESCLGAARVVSESADASIVLEGAVKNFFSAIGEKIRQFWEWIKGIFNKIFKRSKEVKDSKQIEDAIETLENTPDFDDKAKQAPAGDDDKPLYIIDVSKGKDYLSKVADQLCDMSNNTVNDINKQLLQVKQTVNMVRKASGKDDNPGELPDIHKDTDKEVGERAKAIYEDIGKKIGGSIHGREDLLAAIDDAFGCGNKNKPTTELKRDVLMKACKEIKNGTYVKDMEKSLATIEKQLKAAQGFAEAMAKQVNDTNMMASSKAAFTKNLTTYVKRITTLLAEVPAILNHGLSIITSTGHAYYAYIKRTAKGGTPTAESYGMFFENKDLEDDTTGDNDSGDSKDVSEGYGTTGGLLASYVNSYT